MKKRYVIMSILAALVSLIAALLSYPGLPATIAIHWDWSGQPNGYGRRELVFAWPLLMVAVVLLGELLPRLSRQRFRIDSFIDTYWRVLFDMVVMLGFVQVVFMLAQQRGAIDVGRTLVGGMGVFIALVGNLMGKVRRNPWLGIRTPWSLASDKVWYATHRLAGKSMVTTALLCIGMLLAGVPPESAFMVLIGGLLLPAAYSWIYHKRYERNHHNENS